MGLSAPMYKSQLFFMSWRPILFLLVKPPALPGDSYYFQGVPYQLDRIQLRRVRRQIEQPQPPLILLDKLQSFFAAVYRMVVDNQKNRVPGVGHQALEKGDEDCAGDIRLRRHEAQGAFRIDCRN